MGLVTLCFSTRQACRAKKFIGRRAFLFLYETAGGAPPAERAAQCGSSRFKTHYFSLVQFLDALWTMSEMVKYRAALSSF